MAEVAKERIDAVDAVTQIKQEGKDGMTWSAPMHIIVQLAAREQVHHDIGIKKEPASDDLDMDEGAPAHAKSTAGCLTGVAIKKEPAAEDSVIDEVVSESTEATVGDVTEFTTGCVSDIAIKKEPSEDGGLHPAAPILPCIDSPVVIKREAIANEPHSDNTNYIPKVNFESGTEINTISIGPEPDCRPDPVGLNPYVKTEPIDESGAGSRPSHGGLIVITEPSDESCTSSRPRHGSLEC